MPLAPWAWIALVVFSAGAQTVRNVAQRTLARSSGVLPATFVRFLHGLPFAALSLMVVALIAPVPLPRPGAGYLAWIGLGAVAQLVATAFLIAAMGQRSFVVAIAYSKTEILQVAVYAMVLLSEPVAPTTLGAILLSTIGVLALSIRWTAMRDLETGSWFSAGAALGLASGACYALSGVGFRGAMLALDHPLPWVAGVYSVVWAQCIQTALLGTYLVLKDRPGLGRVIGEWRLSTLAGLMGTLASMGWLTAYAMRSAVEVSIASLVDVLFSYALSRRFFRETVTGAEVLGIVLIVMGIWVITVERN
ncbi:MAG: DMT family transporter [Burkholderiales bacterium]|nr:DMT family transporter [Burkholderiales bacterium]